MKNMNLLVTDVEGLDYKIIQTCFSDRIESTVIFNETIHMNREEREMFRKELNLREYNYVEGIKDCLAVKRSFCEKFVQRI